MCTLCWTLYRTLYRTPCRTPNVLLRMFWLNPWRKTGDSTHLLFGVTLILWYNQTFKVFNRSPHKLLRKFDTGSKHYREEVVPMQYCDCDICVQLSDHALKTGYQFSHKQQQIIVNSMDNSVGERSRH